ncbi:ARM repeat-containing protein [Coprinopsis marcescibilis]|uniref:ARM repeat-containing protein n=1 Tax=Coprinopsis marcescibilis TaxID=230819 RepID=A0A5C3KZ08_COPMA|nr:ARM repeat-containing protein [Coprinopsis marcescibilis]
MDIPFSSSGALSRAHYSIVRKVETATSPQQADQFLALEFKETQEHLSKRSLTINKCKECLVILLYCASTATPGFFPPDAFEFGITHALNLADAGKTIEDRRIGYLFCAELMPIDHELRLMMVNTIRKDLESGVVGRVCLALENIITHANEDIVPAVRDIVLDLLLHKHGIVRRRAILALRSLSRFEPQLLAESSGVLVKRLHDPDESVMGAALTASSSLPSSNSDFSRIRHTANGLLSSTGSSYNTNASDASLSILRSLQTLGMSEENIPFALDLIKSASLARRPALVLGVFRLLSQQTPSTIITKEKEHNISAVRCIQDYLTSHNLDDQYFYLACLLCLDPDIWAGTSQEHPIVLEAWEVEKILQFLDSPDTAIRKMTIALVAKIDSAIITTYLTGAIETLRPGLDLPRLNLFATRLLDVVEIITADDGEKYAEGVKDLLQRMSADGIMDRPRVLDAVVEKVLIYIRTSGNTFRESCSTAFLTYLVDSGTQIGPTFIIICSALAVEQIGSTSIAPGKLLQAFCATLPNSSPLVQDACLVSMLRLIAEVDQEEAKSVLESVSELEKRAGRHIRKRCTQVLDIGSDERSLRNAIRNARSSSLPDFLEALEHPTRLAATRVVSASVSEASFRQQPKLRYTAYEAPQQGSKLRDKRSSSILRDSKGGKLDSRTGLAPENQRSRDSVEALNASLTAISLGIELNALEPQDRTKKLFANVPSRPDLISLESPLLTEKEGLSSSEGFESTWNSLEDMKGSRGWCSASVTEALRKLQQMSGLQLKLLSGDIPPFMGELKLIIEGVQGTEGMVLLRLKESEDDSCLWRLRSEAEDLRKVVKRVLSELGQD